LVSLGKSVQEYAHDLNNPLTFVNYYAEQLIKLAYKVQGEIDEQSENLDVEEIEVVEIINNTLPLVDEYSKIIYQSGERASKVINRMQQRYARDGGFKRESIELNSLVTSSINSATHSLQSTFSNSSIEIKTEYDPSIGEVEIVAEDIRRVLINIIDNACYAAYAKSQKFGEGFTPTVLVETKSLGELVQISVTDNGQGIPEEILGKIFDRGFTTKVIGGGTGLGLYIAHTVIEQEHKGKIKVETVPGSYTKFIIVLPRKAA
jgi:signal transduction histidine kinase